MSSPTSRVNWKFGALAAAALLILAVAFDDLGLRRQREDLRSQSADLAGRLQAAQTELARSALRARVLQSEDLRLMRLGGKGPQPGAQGRVLWSASARSAVLLASGLAPLPSDRQYELWVFVGGPPSEAGVFDADASGRAVFESKEFPGPDARNFAVSVEARGGAAAPTGPIVLAGASP